jgi:hypothetical protein
MGEFDGNGLGAAKLVKQDSSSYGVQKKFSYRILRKSGIRKLDDY